MTLSFLPSEPPVGVRSCTYITSACEVQVARGTEIHKKPQKTRPSTSYVSICYSSNLTLTFLAHAALVTSPGNNNGFYTPDFHDDLSTKKGSLINGNVTCDGWVEEGGDDYYSSSSPCSEGSPCLDGDLGVYCLCYVRESTLEKVRCVEIACCSPAERLILT